jgi:hypothetical protein
MNCQFEILAHNTHGYVVFCRDCGHYQLGYGTLVLTAGEQQLDTFHTQLEQARTEAEQGAFPEQKTIRMPVGASHLRMALNVEEAGQLLHLLDGAAASRSFRSLMEEVAWK